jgi:hypothetical protein
VNDFVDKCRREWRRLRVPEAVANEMAADIEADLAEAEGEGATPEEVLGNGVFDPRSFAASWAAERGVIPAPSTDMRRPKRPFILGAIAALVVIAVTGAALAIFARSGSVAIVLSPHPRLSPPPDMHGHLAGVDVHRIGSILLLLSLVAIAFSAVYWFAWGRVQHRAGNDHDPVGRRY